MAVWTPVTVVPTSLATVAIETFITELSSVIRNCPDASVRSTTPVAVGPRACAVSVIVALPARPGHDRGGYPLPRAIPPSLGRRCRGHARVLRIHRLPGGGLVAERPSGA